VTAGDWGEGTTLRIDTIRCVPDASGAISQVFIAYEVRLPSGQVIPQSWEWTPAPETLGQIQGLGQALVADLLSHEGVPLAGQ
jgi:hypothetical protein